MYFWDEFQMLVDELKHDNKTSVANALDAAAKLNHGLTDGWFDFLFAFEKAINEHRNEMTDEQLQLATSLYNRLKIHLRR
jgi:hypothetical protein